MHARPLPIPGLPLAPPIHGLAVLEDVIHATSSHPRRPIAPLPVRTAAAAPAFEHSAKSARRSPHGEVIPPQHRPRTQANGAAPAAASISPRITAAPAAAIVATPAPASSHKTDKAKRKDQPAIVPSRRQKQQQKSTPRFTPIQPETFAHHRHPLAIRTPLDVFRFFPMSISAAALLAGLSGLLAGKIVTHTFGGTTTPALFVAGYLALFLLNLLTLYFSSKGQLFFTCSHRFLRLLAVNALLISPHFIAYTILLGITGK